MNDEEIRMLVRSENNRYLREWRKKNPDKVRAINARYREKRAKQDKEAADAKNEVNR